MIEVAVAVLLLAVLACAPWNRQPELHARTLQGLLTLTPAEFEEEIAVLLRRLGYREVRRTGKAGRRGEDHRLEKQAWKEGGHA